MYDEGIGMRCWNCKRELKHPCQGADGRIYGSICFEKKFGYKYHTKKLTATRSHKKSDDKHLRDDLEDVLI